jgi:Bacterial PH domain
VEKPLTFRSPTAVVVWILVLLFVVGNLVDLAVQGRDHLSAVAAAALLLGAGVAYVTAQRPRVIADDAGVTVRNPLRDHRIGWAGVAEIDLLDLLRVHCAWGGPPGAAPADRDHHKVISAWAIQHSRRRQYAAEVRARRPARRSAMGFPGGFSGRGVPYGTSAPSRQPPAATEAEAERIVKLLQARATAAHAEAAWAASAPEPPALPAQTPPAQTPPAQTPPAQTLPAQTLPAQTLPAQTLPAQTGPAIGTEPAAETSAASGAALAEPGWTKPLASTWSRPAIAALVIPALILLIVILV